MTETPKFLVEVQPALSGELSRAEIIPAGALFTITTGAYSDYQVTGVFRAKRPIDADGLLAQWAKDHPEQAQSHNFKDEEFVAHLAREDYLEDIECWSLHLTDYKSMGEHFVGKHER